MYFLHTNLYLKKLKNVDNKGLMALIALYGDAGEIVKKYEDEEGYTEEMEKQRLLEILNKQAAREQSQAQDSNVFTMKKLGDTSKNVAGDKTDRLRKS
jgi:hypothetical protein